MICVYVFYWIYIHNIQSALTQDIVTDWYWALEQPKQKSNQIETKGDKVFENTPLLHSEAHEGGELVRPVSKEISLEEIERRWLGIDNTITSSRALVTSPKHKSIDESNEQGNLISKEKFQAL